MYPFPASFSINYYLSFHLSPSVSLIFVFWVALAVSLALAVCLLVMVLICLAHKECLSISAGLSMPRAPVTNHTQGEAGSTRLELLFTVFVFNVTVRYANVLKELIAASVFPLRFFILPICLIDAMEIRGTPPLWWKLCKKKKKKPLF